MNYMDAYLIGFFVTWICCSILILSYGARSRDENIEVMLVISVIMAAIWPITVATMIVCIWEEFRGDDYW